jgi:hypothetical protein
LLNIRALCVLRCLYRKFNLGLKVREECVMKKAFIGALGLATALVLAGCTLFYPNSGNPNDELIDPTGSASVEPGEETGPGEATAPSNSLPSPSPSASPTMATAVLNILYTDTSAGVLNVVAEVNNFAEDGGSCTLSYYQGTTATAIATVKAERNVTSTQCFPFNVSFSAVPKGTLSLSVSYKSDNHVGESQKFEVVIP